MRKKKEEQSESQKFEVRLSDGRIKRFENGQDMYNWCSQTRPTWQYELNDNKEKKKPKKSANTEN